MCLSIVIFIEIIFFYYTEPEENNCFSIIAQVIIRATTFSFILLVFSFKTSRNSAAAILKISARPIRARASL